MAKVVAAPRSALGIATGAFVDERDDWARAVARARREHWRLLELGAMTIPRLTALTALLQDDPRAIDGFARISVHAPARDRGDLAGVEAMLLALPYEIVLHPDVYRSRDWVSALGSRAVFENMDVTKTFGARPDDLSEVFGRFPAAGFCLDVAHVWTVDRTLRLGHDLIDAFWDRLRQLHVSGIEPDGSHRPTTAEDFALYEPLLERCRGVPWLLETELVERAP